MSHRSDLKDLQWLPRKVWWDRWAHLEAVEVLRLEVVGRAAAPVHNVLVLALAAQLAVPIGDAQIVIHHGVAVRAVLQDRVEKGLQRRKGPSLRTQ